MLLARGLRDQQAAVAGGPVQEPAFVLVLGGVLGTDRVVRAEAPEVDRGLQVARAIWRPAWTSPPIVPSASEVPV